MNIIALLKLIRIKDWIKNLFVFVPLIFSKHLFDPKYLLKTFLAFLFFCVASSIVYVFNDLKDYDADRQHPKKKKRPIASGAISTRQAELIIAFLSLLLLSMCFFHNTDFIIIAFSYLIMNLFYTISLKTVVILDVFCIAAGFVLRIISGAFAIDVDISSWLLLTTMFLSLFLALSKRYAEMVSLGDNTQYTRKVLNDYSISFLSQMTTISAGATILCYALYTVSDRTIKAFGTENLIFTTPFVVYGIFRYIYLINKKISGENPSDVLYKDVFMLANIVLYVVISVLMIYLK